MCACPLQHMAQEELNLPLRRNKILRSGKPTNLYIPTPTKRSGAINARERYGWSLSRLVSELLNRENKLKGGLLRARMIGEKS